MSPQHTPPPNPSDQTVPLKPMRAGAGTGGEAGGAPQVGPSYRDIIEGYTLLKKLGEGAMGGVFLARQISMDREVAIKILRRELARDQEYVDRFLREARLVAKLEHPNVVRALHAGESRGFYFIVMDYIDGESVKELIDAKVTVPEKQALEIALQVAYALDFAHLKGIVHRDVKPDNILLDAHGSAKLADLGLAKDTSSQSELTQSGTTLGTPHYMSLEQARGEKDIDIRSDICSLGATLFRMVTGRPPFEGPSAGVVIAKRLTEAAPAPCSVNPLVTVPCSKVIEKMMAAEREDRYQAPSEVVRDIKALLTGRDPLPTSPSRRPAPPPATSEPSPTPPAERRPVKRVHPRRKTSPSNATVVSRHQPAARQQASAIPPVEHTKPRSKKLLLALLAAMVVLAVSWTSIQQWELIDGARKEFRARKYRQSGIHAERVWHPIWKTEAQELLRKARLQADLQDVIKHEMAEEWKQAAEVMKKILGYYEGPREMKATYQRRLAINKYKLYHQKAKAAEEKAGADPVKWKDAETMYRSAMNAVAEIEALRRDYMEAENNSIFCLHVALGLEKLARNENFEASTNFQKALQRRPNTTGLSDELRNAMKQAGVNVD
jgi:serine/threonine protein kinase